MTTGKIELKFIHTQRERVIRRAGLGLRESLADDPHGQSLKTVIAKCFLTRVKWI